MSSVYYVHLGSHFLYLTRIPLVKVLQLERVVTHMGLFCCEAESLPHLLPVHVQLRGRLLQELLSVNDDLSDALEFLLEYLFHLLLDELLKLAFLQKRLFVCLLLWNRSDAVLLVQNYIYLSVHFLLCGIIFSSTNWFALYNLIGGRCMVIWTNFFSIICYFNIISWQIPIHVDGVAEPSTSTWRNDERLYLQNRLEFTKFPKLSDSICI